jgi:hypothetical protein
MEFQRLLDLLDALQTWEQNPWIVVINDANPPITRESIARSAPHLGSLRLDIIQNPRGGRGWGWSGGLVLGELAALRFIHGKGSSVPFVIKCDTDALPTAPFAERLAACFRDSSVGLVGSRVIDEIPGPGRTTPPIGYFRNKIRKMRAPFALWRKPRWHVRSPLWCKRTRELRDFLGIAILRGYTPGELIEGGAMAFSGDVVAKICGQQIDQREEMVLHLCVSDDLFLTPLAYFLGKRAINSDLFCIEPAGLRYPPKELVAKCPEAAWIHSLKGPTPDGEQEARNYLKATRRRLDDN